MKKRTSTLKTKTGKTDKSGKSTKSSAAAKVLRPAKRAAPGGTKPSPEPEPLPIRISIHGQVRQADGTPLPNVDVRAIDKGLAGQKELGNTKTDNDGQYTITYASSAVLDGKGSMADLIVQVLDKAGNVLVSSQTIFNVQQDQTVDLMIGGGTYRGLPHFDQRTEDLSPLLQGVPLGNLTTDQITFLSEKSGIDQQEITLLNAAARLAQEANRPILSPDIFYAFCREGLPTDLPSLLAQSPQVQRAALESALDKNLIPLSQRTRLDQIMAALSEAIVDQAFKSPGEGRAALSDLLGTVIKNPVNQRTILTLYVNHRGTIQEFWTSLRTNDVFKDQVDNIQLTLQLGILTQNHVPLVQELQRIILGPVAGPKTSLRDLAKFDEEDWKNFISRKATGIPLGVPGKNDTERLDNYAKVMTRMLADAFATTALAGRIAKSDLQGKENYLTFFDKDPNFDFRTEYIENYLAKHPDALDGINDKEFKSKLKAMQRVFRLTPHYAEMQALLADGLHSAQSIMRMGRSVFLNKYSAALGGTARAKTIYENASRVTALALNLYGRFGSFNGIEMQVLPKYTSPNGGSPPALAETPGTESSIPDWKTLFGSLDMCACEDCRSVYSPAAYMVDILQFLDNRRLIDQITKDNNGKIVVIYKQITLPDGSKRDKTAKDVLFERRPDLGEIDLNCENAFTPLPYVDLLNEVLENAVSPATALPAHDRQTNGTPQELEANPQYQNAGAYGLLSGQIYPWGLPFNLWWEEGRMYLGHLGVQRAELMKTFKKIGTPSDPTNLEIACEYLGIRTFERQIITGATVDPARKPYEFWGYAAADSDTWTDKDHVAHVRTFLDRSGLTYDDLVELLIL